jgi:redox-sensitive bicupin YhaK (pirin superfamily)
MGKNRKIRKIIQSKPTIEGAGVHLRRAFGFGEVPLFDPFLLLDDFRSDNPEHYIKGFPWHPHRGIETITYVLNGNVEHGDSIGNKGCIGPGDVQWMTAGSGILHQEMPKGDNHGIMGGFQLWANLPASNKMMEPRYRDIKSDQIPVVSMDNGVNIKVICGKAEDTVGPVTDVVIGPEYLDITIPENAEYIHRTKTEHTVFAYVIDGEGYFESQKASLVDNQNVILFGDGEQILVSTGDKPIRFLLISGKPIGEPIAWRGPIVMNTDEELRIAFEEYRNGTFIKNTSLK